MKHIENLAETPNNSLTKRRFLAWLAGAVALTLNLGTVSGIGIPPRLCLPTGQTSLEEKLYCQDRIALASSIKGQYDVLIVRADGTDPINLTDDAGSDMYPRWSPDGKRIAFFSNRELKDALYVMDSHGRNIKKLLEDHVFEYFFSWSPDGKEIAYSMDDGSICSVNSEGFSKPRRLTNIFGMHRRPIYSPDGRKIVFEMRIGNKRNIGLMDSNGKNPEMLTDNEFDFFPSWSPDGEKIVYFSKGKICVMNSDGSGTEELTKEAGDCWDPFYSPDGEKILYRTEADGKDVVCVMNKDGTGKKNLTADFDISMGARWSPDGGRIVFYSKKKGDWHVYTVKADGTEKPDRLIENAGSTLYPSWCPK